MVIQPQFARCWQTPQCLNKVSLYVKNLQHWDKKQTLKEPKWIECPATEPLRVSTVFAWLLKISPATTQSHYLKACRRSWWARDSQDDGHQNQTFWRYRTGQVVCHACLSSSLANEVKASLRGDGLQQKKSESTIIRIHHPTDKWVADESF